ncbi:histone methyltransferase set2, partial [Cladochytrium tenue]
MARTSEHDNDNDDGNGGDRRLDATGEYITAAMDTDQESRHSTTPARNEFPGDQDASIPASPEEYLSRFTLIAENQYRGGASGRADMEFAACFCKYDPDRDSRAMACGDESDCINRVLFLECAPDDCPCGEYCLNQRFRKKEYAPFQVIKTQKKGFGLRATAPIKSHQFVIEYCGEVLPSSMFSKRVHEYSQSGVTHFYFMSLKSDEIIDAYQKGNLARFMNHSCAPNCELQKWVVGSQLRMGLFALRDIKEGEELTFDYKFERYGAEPQICYCGETTDENEGDIPTAGRRSPRRTLEDDEDYVEGQVLYVLQSLPPVPRNSIIDSKLEDTVEKLKESSLSNVADVSKALLSAWADLPTVYKIPKKLNEEASPDDSRKRHASTPAEEDDRKRGKLEPATPANSNGLPSRPELVPTPVRGPDEPSVFRPRVASVRKQDDNGRSWSHSSARSSDTGSPAAVMAEPQRQLLPGWSATVAENGKTYYYNVATRETQWDPPLLEPEPAFAQVEEPKKPSLVEGFSEMDIAAIVEEASAAASKSFVENGSTPEANKKLRAG